MLWSEFLIGLDKLRSDIRASRLPHDKVNDFDPILNTLQSLIALQPLPKEDVPPDDLPEVPPDGPSEGARALQVGEVKGYVEPRTTPLIIRAPVLEDGEELLAGENGDE